MTACRQVVSILPLAISGKPTLERDGHHAVRRPKLKIPALDWAR